MPLHPQAQAMIDTFSGPAVDYTTLSASEFRSIFDVPKPTAQANTSIRISEQVGILNGKSVRMRLYYPKGVGPFPMILYVHGGGFVIGSPETTDGVCCTLAEKAEGLVISPDYGLAPEAPFPAGLNDCWLTLQWAQENATELGLIPDRIAVAGDSSGGNFAAAIAQMASDSGLKLRHQLLLYPVLDCCFDTRSYASYAHGYFLTQEMMRWFWKQYLPANAKTIDSRVSPLRRSVLDNLPETTIVTAEYDVLRDEAEAYACRLIHAGIPTKVRRYNGQIHGFLLQQGLIDDADAALDMASKALKLALHK